MPSSMPERISPPRSAPMAPATQTSAPREQRLFTTFPAPPRVLVSSFTRTTGTGASGEMRSTVPQ